MKKFIIPLSAFIVFAFLIAPAIYAAFTSPINLTSVNSAFDPVIDADGAGVLHAAWEERTSTGSDIIYAQSTDDGLTFPAGSRINLSITASLISTNPQIKVDSADNIYIVWEEDDPTDGEPEIYGVKSSNGGTSFSAKKNISNDSLFSGSAYIETSASDKVHIVWAKETVGGDQLIQAYYSSSTDGGATFSTPVNISNTAHNLDKPIIRAKNSTIGVIWQGEGPDFGIYRVLSTDNGVTFGSVLNISSNTTTHVIDPAIGIDGSGRVHMVAAAFVGSEPEIFYSRSTDGGVTFGTPVNLSNSTNDISADPNVLAVGEGTVFVTWSENVCGESGCKKSIRVRKSTDGGVTFATATSPDALQVLTSVVGIDFDVFGVNLYMIWDQAGVVQFMKGS